MATSKHVKLGKIAEIINGIPDAKQTSIDSEENSVTYNFIQPNHLGLYNNIQGFSEIKRQNTIADDYLLRIDDILLKRLNPDNSVVIDQTLSNTVFSSNLFVIRIQDNYNPAYIASVLENSSWENSNLVGSASTIRSISLKTLAELDIPNIDYEKQKAIGQIWLLHKKRQRLLDDFKAEDHRLIATIISSIISGTKEEK